MDTEVQSKEHRFLHHVRKTLSNIVKEVSPPGGQANPFTNSTIEEIMSCFDLISERENELAGKLGSDQARPPKAAVMPPGSSALSFVKLPRR